MVGGVQAPEVSRAAARMGRWLLLACTVIGLAAMHTLGHGASHTTHGDAHAGSPADAGSDGHPAGVTVGAPLAAGTVAVAVAAAPGQMLAAADGCGDGCAHGDSGGPGRHDIPLWSVCLAVLGVAALLAWLVLRRRSGRDVDDAAGAVRVGETRAPPRAGVGMRVAAASVMRI